MKILKGNLNKSVVTLGKFDCLHQGHKKLISEAKKISEELGIPLVAYTFSNVLREKVFSFEQRLKIFEELGCDYVYVEEFSDEFKNLSPEEFFADKLVENLGAVHIVAGTDWKFGKDRAGDAETLGFLCRTYHTGLTIVDKLTLYGEEVSTTLIKKLFEEGNIKRANEYLGRCYHIEGKVSEGKKLGRKLGFPTANISLEKDFVYPKDGVYATKTLIDGCEYYSVTNIGTNPTVNDETKKAETHIFDYNGNLYEKEITVYFCDFIREETRFDSIEQLKCQIDKDCLYWKNQKI